MCWSSSSGFWEEGLEMAGSGGSGWDILVNLYVLRASLFSSHVLGENHSRFFLLNEDGFVRAPSDSSCSLSLSLDVTSSNSCKSHQAVGGFDSQQQLSPALERFTPGVWGVDRTQIGSAPDCRDWS